MCVCVRCYHVCVCEVLPCVCVRCYRVCVCEVLPCVCERGVTVCHTHTHGNTSLTHTR